MQFGVNRNEKVFQRQQIKFISAYCTNLQEKSCYSLLRMCMKKHHRKWRHTEFFKRARAIYNVHSYYSFALRVHENALVLDEQKRINFSGTLLVTKSDIKDNKVNPLWLWDEEIFQSFLYPRYICHIGLQRSFRERASYYWRTSEGLSTKLSIKITFLVGYKDTSYLL